MPLHTPHNFDLGCDDVDRVVHLGLLLVLRLGRLVLRHLRWVVRMPSLVDTLGELGVEWQRTLPGARLLVVPVAAYHAVGMPHDRMVAMLEMAVPASAECLAP